ncbi:hypothetical protein KAW18_11365 [candidate division WOR-3 bacterium]|nr:hypothetical protein [candidate division WOR-3 bacterium]
MKDFFKAMGNFILLLLISVVGVIPVFLFAILLILLISIGLPSIGIGFVPFLILSIILFVVSLFFVLYARSKNLWRNLRFWGLFTALPLVLLILINIIIPPIIKNSCSRLEELVKKNLRISDVEELYKVPGEKNSAHLLKYLKVIPGEKENLVRSIGIVVTREGTIPDSIRKEVKDMRNLISPYTVLIDSFYQYEYFQYVWQGDYADSLWTIPLPAFVDLITVARAGIIGVVLDIERGNNRKAYIGLQKVWHLAKLIGSEPYLINSMVSYVIGGTIYEHLCRGINEGWALRKEIKPIIDEFYNYYEGQDVLLPGKPKMMDDRIESLSSLSMELFYYKRILKVLSEKDMRTKSLFSTEIEVLRLAMTSFVPFFGFIPSYEYSAGLELIRTIIPRPFNSWQSFTEYYIYEEGYKKVERTFNRYSEKIPYLYFSITTPNYHSIIMRGVSFKAKTRILKTASDIEGEKKKTGKYPEGPSSILRDPFTNKELVYRLKDDGFMIYSVGENLKDDNGEEDDIVFERSAGK